MPNKADENALAATLDQAGISNVDPRKISRLAYGGASKIENEAVRITANDLLLKLLKKDAVGQCIHLTGEMRALADPFHRKICEQIYKRSQNKFSLVYNIPLSFRETPQGVAQWNITTWRKSGWIDLLSAFNIIGNDIVDVYAYDTLDQIQFTVFGNRYVLLQEKHKDEVETNEEGAPIAKRVWLLESERLNHGFFERASQIKSNSDIVPDALFRRFAVSVHGVTSREIISRLLKAYGVAHYDRILDDRLLYFDPQAEAHLVALKTIGFVKSDSARMLTLTGSGRQYFDTVKGKGDVATTD